MSLTKVSYSMITGAVVNVLDCGADRLGVTSSSASFAAAIAELPNGGIVFVPQGTYSLTSAVALTANITILGEGISTILAPTIDNYFYAASINNLYFEQVNFLSNKKQLTFTLCNYIQFLNCYGNGGIQNSQGFYFAGCDEVKIINPSFFDYRDPFYFTKSGTTPCGTIEILGGSIWQTQHGSGISSPTGVYAVSVKHLIVHDVVFKNIKPSSDAGSGSIGYCVYEGDGAYGDLESVNVANCTFLDDDGYSTYPMVGVLTSLSLRSTVDGCQFTGSFKAFAYGSAHQTIQNCLFDSSWIQTGASAGVANYPSLSIVGNKFVNIAGAQPLAIQQGPGVVVNHVLIANNFFNNCDIGTIWLNYVNYAEIIGNVFTAVNTAAHTDDWNQGGVNFYGCEQGLVTGNTFDNGTTGKMTYGVVSSNVTNAIIVSQNNHFIGMLTSAGKNLLTAPPSSYPWEQGANIYNWSASSGNPSGWICITAGTPGTWKAMANLA